jgi:hypothetical protein
MMALKAVTAVPLLSITWNSAMAFKVVSVVSFFYDQLTSVPSMGVKIMFIFLAP